MSNNPPFYRGIINISKSGYEKKIEYYYPSNLKWTCVFCGKCCKDIEDWNRTVKLLKKDIARLEKVGEEDFYVRTKKTPFIGVMKKLEGKCIFLGKNVCTVYQNRALLCRMYPFWVEKQSDIFYIYVDEKCSGIRKGEILNEEFYSNLLTYALEQMDY